MFLDVKSPARRESQPKRRFGPSFGAGHLRLTLVSKLFGLVQSVGSTRSAYTKVFKDRFEGGGDPVGEAVHAGVIGMDVIGYEKKKGIVDQGHTVENV